HVRRLRHARVHQHRAGRRLHKHRAQARGADAPGVLRQLQRRDRAPPLGGHGVGLQLRQLARRVGGPRGRGQEGGRQGGEEGVGRAGRWTGHAGDGWWRAPSIAAARRRGGPWGKTPADAGEGPRPRIGALPARGGRPMTTIEDTASRILDVGDRRFWRDDYEARMDAFADVLEGLDPAARAELFDEILEQDGGATLSWLTVDRLDRLVGEGRITAQERTAVLEAFGQAYLDGEIELPDALAFTSLFGSGATGGIGLNPDPGPLQDLLATLEDATGNSPAFLEAFATDVLQQRLFPEHALVLPHERDALAGILLNALDLAG